MKPSKSVSLALRCGLLVGLSIAPAAAQPHSTLNAARALQQAATAAIAKCGRGVVAIARARKGLEADALTDPGALPREFCAGVVVEPGVVVTTAHSLGQPQQNEYAIWTQGRPLKARVLATDPWTDLAALGPAGDGEAVVWRGLFRLPLGDPDELRKGQLAIALGNPFGIAADGEVSASAGLISNLMRKAPESPGGGRSLLHHFGALIQTGAAVPAGASGSALVNLEGELVGLLTDWPLASESSEPGGLAIPVSETFRRVVTTLAEGKSPEHGLLGIAPGTGRSDLTYEERAQGRIGAVVHRLVVGAPARDTSLRMDDVIVAVNGRPVRDADALIREIGGMPPGATARLTVERGEMRKSQRFVEETRVAKREPDEAHPAYQTAPVRQWRGLQVDWTTAMPGFRQGNHAGSIDPEGCVAIINIIPNSAAGTAGLREGAFITHVAGRRVKTPQGFYRQAESRTGEVNVRVSTAPGRFVTTAIPP